MRILIIASNNQGKISEFKRFLGDFFIIKSMKDANISLNINETGLTFEENAIIKAQTLFDYIANLDQKSLSNLLYQSGDTKTDTKNIEKTNSCTFSVLSDDSGLMVDALNGEPGIYSARYSQLMTDKANNTKLLQKLIGVKNRNAKFVAALAFINSDNKLVVAKGESHGTILEKEQGENGFGYDSLFFSAELNKTFAQASEQEKNTVSHRAKALQNLLNMIKNN